MKVEMTFNNDAVLACGYHKEEIYRKIKNEFQKRGLVCASDGEILAFEDTGKEDDYAYMWNVIKNLMISDWFLNCATSCDFTDDDEMIEDVLSQAHLFQRI